MSITIKTYPTNIEIFTEGNGCISIDTDGTQGMIDDLLRNGSNDISPEVFAKEDVENYFDERGIELSTDERAELCEALEHYYAINFDFTLYREYR